MLTTLNFDLKPFGASCWLFIVFTGHQLGFYHLLHNGDDPEADCLWLERLPVLQK